MEELRITGIVISTIDYKEKDKLITIFSLELGKVSAILKGVKNKNAKLKFAGQVFCFAEFILVKRGNYYTVISAEQIESFYGLVEDYSKYAVGAILLEIINYIMQPSVISERLFLNTLKCFKTLVYDEEVVINTILIKFLLYIFKISGYEISLERCNECGMPFNSDVYFNYELGYLTCKNCSGHFNAFISKKNLNVLKFINNSTLDNLNTVKVKDEDLIDVIKILNKNFENKFGYKLKSLISYLNL